MSLKLRIKHIWNKTLLQLSFFLFAFYLVIGFLFLFTDTWKDFISQGREIIGSSLMLFGCLRFYTAYMRYKNKHDKLQELKRAKKALEESQHVKIE